MDDVLPRAIMAPIAADIVADALIKMFGDDALVVASLLASQPGGASYIDAISFLRQWLAK